MPLAREVGRIAVLLEELGDCRCALREAVRVARHHHDRKRRTDRDAPGHERGPARGATRLAVPTGEDGAFLGDLIDIRGRMAQVRATTIGPEVIPARVVGHQHDDVWLLLGLDGRCSTYTEKQNNKSKPEPYFIREVHGESPFNSRQTVVTVAVALETEAEASAALRSCARMSEAVNQGNC